MTDIGYWIAIGFVVWIGIDLVIVELLKRGAEEDGRIED